MFRWEIDLEIDLRLLEPSMAFPLYNLVEQNFDFLSKWLNWAKKASDFDYVEQYIIYAQDLYSENRGFHAGIFYKNILVGLVSFEYSRSNKSGSLGYWLVEDFNGNGIVTRACKAIVDYAFDSLCLNRIEIRCASKNYKSQGIPTRLGFKKEGLIRHGEELDGVAIDHILYGLTIEDFRKGEL